MRIIILTIFIITLGCDKGVDPLFVKLPSSMTGIDFVNRVTSNDTLNAFNFINFYNGAGVGIADFNNDSLPDVCMISNQQHPILYLNKGKMSFEKITTSGLINQGWINGISIVDINQDGWNDIYFSTAKNFAFKNSKNLLYINQKTKQPTFKEEGSKYGLDFDGYTTQTAFFDYDNDGDLDAYLLNTNPNATDPNTYRRSINDGSFPSTDRLYKNIGRDSLGYFQYKDISKEAGIMYEGLGLGIALADYDGDGYTDVYCSDDFISDDILYINDGQGKYRNQTKKAFKHTSLFGMGVDAADINNDGKIDIMQLDMMPGRNDRRKMMLMRNDYDRKSLTISSQYNYMLQYMRNTLQINKGSRDSIPLFSEQSLMHNVAATDWSWGVLLADYDNDGWKDMYITNGYRKNVTDLDFINFHQSGESARGKRLTTDELLKIVPEIKLNNYAYKNTMNQGYQDVSKDWGLDDLSYSNGVAHADLDLDGDLDLIVNNIDEEAFVYENKSKINKSISIDFVGEAYNHQGIGASVTVYQRDKTQTYTHFPVRGYLSSMVSPLLIGLGQDTAIDSVQVKWQSGKMQVISGKGLASKIVLQEKFAMVSLKKIKPYNELFTEVNMGIDYTHEESGFIDFHTSATLAKMITRQGPVMAKGYIDQDTLEDLVIGGAYSGSPSQVYFQEKSGGFIKGPTLATQHMEVGAIAIVDINGDNSNDVVIAPGVADKSLGKNIAYYPMTFITNSHRSLVAKNILPLQELCTSKILVTDVDGNGLQDLLFTPTYILGSYPKSSSAILMLQEKKGGWKIEKPSWLPANAVSDILLSDIDKDGDKDMLYAGHWSSINILEYKDKNFVPKDVGIPMGWWNAIHPIDIDGDGDEDLVLGNEGLNTYFKANAKQAVTLYSKDFNGDSVLDPIYTQYIDDAPQVCHPLGTLTEQCVHFKKRFTDFTSYSKATLYDVLKPKELRDAMVYKATEFRSCIAINDGKGNYTLKHLPFEVQSSPILNILDLDVNKDGKKDILLTGNFYPNDAVQGRSDASYGHVLTNGGNGKLSLIAMDKSGFKADGDIRSSIRMKNGTIILGVNGGKVRCYRKNI